MTDKGAFEEFASQIRTVEQQEQWWEENRSDLTEEDKQELFDAIVEEGKFDNLEILIQITLDNSDSPEKFIDDLRRIESIVDEDLAWGKFFKELRNELDQNTQTSEKIYERLVDEESDFLNHVAGLALGSLKEDRIIEEVTALLSARENILVAESAIKSRYEEERLPEEILEEMLDVSQCEEHHKLFLAASSVVFPSNPKLWERSVEIAESSHENVPFILSNFSYRISEEHSEDYLELLRIAIEEDQGPVINRFSYILRNELASKTDEIADFLVWLSRENRFEAGRLASQLVDENEDLREALRDRYTDFPNNATAEHVFESLGLEITDKDIIGFLRTLEKAYTETNASRKGDLLEDASEELLEMIPGLKHARNVETRQSEIDILVHNRSERNAMRRMGDPLLIECRNRDEKVDPQDVLVLEGKMRNHGAETGFFVCRSGYTEGVKDQIAKCRITGRDKQIGIITMEDLRDLSSVEEIEELILDKFDEISEFG